MRFRNDVVVDYETYDEVEEFWKPIPDRKKVEIVETKEVFDSVKDLASYFGIRPTGVSRVLSGPRKGQRIHGVHIRELDEGISHDHRS